MAFALACLALVLLLPIPYLMAWQAVLTDHGYAPCEPVLAGRRTVYRRYRASGPCR